MSGFADFPGSEVRARLAALSDANPATPAVRLAGPRQMMYVICEAATAKNAAAFARGWGRDLHGPRPQLPARRPFPPGEKRAGTGIRRGARFAAPVLTSTAAGSK